MGELIAAVLRDPLIVAFGTFVIGVAALVTALAVTTTRRWHDRHHESRSELMCDHCRERQRMSPTDAPRMRVLGERRW